MMVKKSTALRLSRSVLHASMFCATYPPPPGSDPGYHDAHQLTASRVARVITGTAHTASVGQKDSTASALPKVVPGGVPAGWAAPSFDFSTSIPPTWFTATTASRMAPPASKKYCMASVAATPQKPDTTV